MKAKILNALSDNELPVLLGQGNIGVIPTDTLYGLVVAAHDHEAVTRFYRLKKRERKPGTVIAADIDQLVLLGLKARYIKPVAPYWPNPLSILIPCGPELSYLHQSVGSLAVRIPRDKGLISLVKQTGPLLTTSANPPGKPPANTMQEAASYFGDNVDFYVDGGDLSGRPPSTVIRVVDDMVEVVRRGAVKINEAGRILK